MKRLMQFPALVLTLLLALGLAGCASTGTSTPATPQTTVLRLAGGDWGLPNPFRHHPRGPGIAKMELLYDSLLEKGETGDIPWLAAKWEIAADGRTYLFTLQDQIKWHDGQPLTAEDVKFSFDYYKQHPAVVNELFVNGRYIIDQIEVIDPKSIKLTVTTPNATYLSKIGAVRILPKHIWENVDDPVKFTGPAATIGSGPFMLEAYDGQQGTYRFKAFEQYWGPRPRVNAIEWVPVSDPVLAFEKGDIDLVDIKADLLPRYQNKPEFAILQNQMFHAYRLIFNMENRPELKDVKVRKAFAYALDREEMIQKVARGSGIVGNMGCLPPGHGWYNPAVAQYSFDPEKARQLLANRPLSLTLLIENSSLDVKMAELMKISLAKAGITLDIKSTDSKTRDAALAGKNYDLILVKTGNMGKDADYLRTYYGTPTKANRLNSGSPGYYNATIQALAEQQMQEMDPAKRKQIIFELQEHIAADVPQIILYYTIESYVYRPAKFNGWLFRYDHSPVEHAKLSYLLRGDH